MKTVRVGIVGAGFVAELHAESFARIPNAEVTAVASRTEERARAFAERFQIP
ncbi:MAG: hypothetical protein C4345_13560, partial [Chloroflexota bacterium]